MPSNAVTDVSSTSKESSCSLLSNKYLTLIRILFLTKIGCFQKVANLPPYPVMDPYSEYFLYINGQFCLCCIISQDLPNNTYHIILESSFSVDPVHEVWASEK